MSIEKGKIETDLKKIRNWWLTKTLDKLPWSSEMIFRCLRSNFSIPALEVGDIIFDVCDEIRHSGNEKRKKKLGLNKHKDLWSLKIIELGSLCQKYQSKWKPQFQATEHMVQYLKTGQWPRRLGLEVLVKRPRRLRRHPNTAKNPLKHLACSPRVHLTWTRP